MQEKNNVRYIGFRSAGDGGRLFDFSVSAAANAGILTSFEIPAALFTGDNHIRLQEGVGICYAKLKNLLEIGPLADVPSQLCITALDVGQYREVRPGPKRRATQVQDTGIS